MTITRDLSEFVCEVTFKDLPDHVVRMAKKLVLDMLGSIIYSSRMEWSEKVVALVRRLGYQGKCTVIPHGFRTSAPAAALANGTMGHGYEIDDVHESAMIHPGAVVIPAALAVAEQQSVDGREFLLGVVAGYDVMCRIGMAVGAKSHILRGFHPTGTIGPFGAAVAAGKIFRLSQERIIDALGIAGSFCSGLMEFSQETSEAGGMIKRLHAGRASESGVIAGLLAGDGFRGPSDIIGGKYGFCNVYSDKPQMMLANKGMGLNYEILNVGIKPYPCCQTLHSAIDGITNLKNQYELRVEEIDEIRVGGSEKLVSYHGIYEIDSIMAAQFSIPFCMALSLLGDIKDPNSFRVEFGKMEATKQIMGKVKLFKDEDLERIFPGIAGAKIIVKLKNGRSLESQVMYPKGTRMNEMSFEEVCDKFDVLAQGIIDKRKISGIIEKVRILETLQNISELTELFVTTRKNQNNDL